MSFNTSLATNMDKVRFECGDTDTTAEQVADATITALLTMEGDNVLLTAARVCDHLAAKYSAIVSTANGALSISDAQSRAEAFRKRAAELRVRARAEAGTSAHVVVGGQTFTQADRMDADTDTIKPRVRMGGFQNRRGGGGRAWLRRGEC